MLPALAYHALYCCAVREEQGGRASRPITCLQNLQEDLASEAVDCAPCTHMFGPSEGSGKLKRSNNAICTQHHAELFALESPSGPHQPRPTDDPPRGSTFQIRMSLIDLSFVNYTSIDQGSK